MRVHSVPTPIAFSVGLFLFAVYLLSFRGGFHSVDEVSTFAVTENLVKFGQVHTNQVAWTQWVTTQAEAQGFFGRDGQVYSKKGLAISLFQAPLYALALLVPGLGMLQTVSLLNAILTAWTGGLLVSILLRLGFERRTALLTALIFGLGTIAWVYAKYLFSGTLAGFLLLLTLYLLLRFPTENRLWLLVLAGFAAGLTVLTRANNLLLLPWFGLYLLALCRPPGESWPAYLRNHWRRWLPLLLLLAGGGVLAGGLFAGYNALRSGNPLQTGYDLSLFTPNVLLGLYKLLFSPLRGLFVYSPILMLALPGWWLLRRRHPAEAWLSLALVVTTLGLFSAWSSGEGLSWGSRFLVPLVPFFALSLAPVVDWWWQARGGLRVGAAALFVLSLLIQVLAVSINPWVYLGRLQAELGGAFFLERTVALYDFSRSQIVGQLQNLSVQHSDLVWWQPWGFDGLALGGCLVLVLATAHWLWRTASGTTSVWNQPWMLGGHVLLALVISLALLWRYAATDRQFGPTDDPYTRALQQVAAAHQPGDRLVTVAQYSYHVPMNRFKTRLPLLGFAQNETGLPDTALPLLTPLLRSGGDIWLITVGRPPADPSNQAEAWLVRHAFKAEDRWLDDVRLLRFGTAADLAGQALNLHFGETLHLQAVARPAQVVAGSVLPLALHWQVDQPPAQDYRLFVQLLDINGALVAQRDGWPQGGYAPSSQWSSGETIIDHHGLALPPDLPSGDYRLIGGVVDPVTGARLSLRGGGDFAELGTITVTAGQP